MYDEVEIPYPTGSICGHVETEEKWNIMAAVYVGTFRKYPEMEFFSKDLEKNKEFVGLSVEKCRKKKNDMLYCLHILSWFC